jgi:hypothetical protein
MRKKGGKSQVMLPKLLKIGRQQSAAKTDEQADRGRLNYGASNDADQQDKQSTRHGSGYERSQDAVSESQNG